MSKYERLTIYLAKRKERELILTFEEVENIAGVALPKSKERPQFWANAVSEAQRNPVNKAIREGGYSAFLLKGMSKVRFVRD